MPLLIFVEKMSCVIAGFAPLNPQMGINLCNEGFLLSSSTLISYCIYVGVSEPVLPTVSDHILH